MLYNIYRYYNAVPGFCQYKSLISTQIARNERPDVMTVHFIHLSLFDDQKENVIMSEIYMIERKKEISLKWSHYF